MLLKACLNGARRPAEHAGLPITAAELASDAAEVHAAGVGAVHLHVKDHAGADTLEAVEVAAALEAVRRAMPLPVGVTTGAWASPVPAERVAAIERWTALPDFASVNWHEDGAEEVAAALLARGVAVEAGLWHEDAAAAWLASPHRHRCLRVMIELPDGLDPAPTRASAELLLNLIRKPAGGRTPDLPPILLHGEGSSCWPALRFAAEAGLDTRIGLEDTLLLPDGSAAPNNRALVEAALTELASRTGPD